MQKSKHKPSIFRRQLIVDKTFQSSFIKLFTGSAVLVNMILYCANLAIFYNFNKYGETLKFEERQKFYQFFQDQVITLNKVFLITGVAVFVLLFIYGIFASHKVAGPLFNLKLRLKSLQEITNLEDVHNLTGTQFRKSDYFKDLAKEYNMALTNIQKLQFEKGEKSTKNNSEDNTNITEKFDENVIAFKKVS